MWYNFIYDLYVFVEIGEYSKHNYVCRAQNAFRKHVKLRRENLSVVVLMAVNF